jgi:hypothetical protein
MVNRAIAAQAASNLAEKAEESQAKRERAEHDKLTKGFPKRLKLGVEPDGTPRVNYFTPIHPSDEFIDLQIHFVFDNVTKAQVAIICDEQYKGVDPAFATSCKICGEHAPLDDKGSHPRASFVKAFLGHIFNYEDQVFTDRNGKDHPFGTERVVEVRAAKGKVNFQKMDTLNQKNAFQPGRFIFSLYKSGQGTETTYSAPEIVPIDLLGDEFNPHSEASKKTLEEAKKRTIDENWQRILVNYGNVLWDVWGLEDPRQAAPAAEPEAPTPAPTKVAKRKLDA